MYEISTRLAIALAAYLDFERPTVLRAEVQDAIREAVGVQYDGKREEAELKPALDQLAKASVKLGKIEAGYTGPRTFESVLKATGKASAQLRGIGL